MRKRKLTIVATAAALVVAGGAYAAIPASDGVITSCRDSSGVLRVIDTAVTTTCPAGTEKLAWNAQGRTGPTGPRGPQGERGPGDLHWVHLNATGGLIAKSDSDAYYGNWGTGRYYAGFPKADFSKCALSVEPVLPYGATPVMSSIYMPSYGYALVELKSIRPSSWPIVYDPTDAEVYITASCAVNP
jgi:hypothetical protein